VPGYDTPPDYRLRTDASGIHRYSWCTPAFILGTLMVEPRPASDWTMISSQNRWHGVIFAGHPQARIMPQCQARDERVAFNAQWSVQSKGTLICQKLKTHKHAGAMRVWFSQAGLSNRCEEAGWVFVESPGAFAAVRVVNGSAKWEPSEKGVKGDWLRCQEEWTPVILEVACKEDYAGYGAFRRAVTALPLDFNGDVLNYTGLGGDTFSFFTAQNSSPRINGAPVNFETPEVFDSPFIRSDWNSGVVTLTRDGRNLVLNFNP
jgi:hypothetical protein